jgi:serine phosphatase RsbU (regulator of sigma subunit)
MLNDEDELIFADDDSDDISFTNENSSEEPTKIPATAGFTLSGASWKVMIADDEDEIHTVTRFALGDYQYKGKRLQFLQAYTGDEAIRLLSETPDVAIILLDVVMETTDAGLRAVQRIRGELKNEFVRIVMRTGQPGQAPEDEVILKYDINDYKNKTELTDKKLFTTITTGLRSYSDIMEIEEYRQNLEQKVAERTAEVTEQKPVIEKKNEDITASINYASRIQESMLPSVERMKMILPNLFVLFKPRDIVSGDFFWFAEKDGKIIIAAIDCTGHGVPGAFMSMIGDAHLNQIVNTDAITSPDVILNKLHLRIRQALKQAETQNRDGMDMTICVIDRYRKIMEFAGAKNPIAYIQAGEVVQIKGDRYPIGGEQREDQRIFTKQIIPIDKPTWVYMFSDGFPDQFGGPENKKFMIRSLRDMFLQIHQLPFNEQLQLLDDTFEQWKNYEEGNRQTDDVLVVGFKIEF